ncbi:MAG: inorganic phosphate transporter, partial [Candidatus Binatia bacterium]
MSHRITEMERGEAFAGNLATAVLVLAASWLALPVSTTHVSCGSLFGIGALTGRARWKTIGEILGAWVATLPLGAVLGAGAGLLVSR